VLPKAILLACLAFFYWLIRRDTARRNGISRALWLPTIWVGIIASRPLSMWLGFGGATDTLEGSPVDRLFFMGCILMAFVILWRRRLVWSAALFRNWPVFLFYAYLLVSVLWAEFPLVSFKRWFKEFGNIVVALVILTEVDPQEAIRAVFVRCAYVLIPLSLVFIRYFPQLGRYYNQHSGVMEAVGVGVQKNSLGALVVIGGLGLTWDWLERSQPGAGFRGRFDRYWPFVVLGIGVYLLWLCDSKTSILCLAIGAFVLSTARMPLLRERIRLLGFWAVALVLLFFSLDALFGIKEAIVRGLGRDMTFTGRTNVWRELLALHTDPLLGTGFCSFWSDQHYLSRLPPGSGVGTSAHNGYLEVFIDGGMVGLFFLGMMLLATGMRINRQLGTGGNYVLMQFAAFVAMVVGSFSESHFGRMSPLGFLFLLTAIGEAQTASASESTVAAYDLRKGNIAPQTERPEALAEHG